LTQVEPGHYEGSYDSLPRFASYWYQLDEALRARGPILEIGIGNGTVSRLLRQRGLDVTTCDLDAELDPDVVADVRALPFPDGTFDTALACEVLEHLPWSDVSGALRELRRVTRTTVVLSVPDQTPRIDVAARIPNAAHLLRLAIRGRIHPFLALWALTTRAARSRGGGDVTVAVEFGRLHPAEHVFDGEHYWELGTVGASPAAFATCCAAADLDVRRTFRPIEHPYHHFFVARCV
jgi:SAM-dependent methyltransferase